MYLLDTDTLSQVVKRSPSIALLSRLAVVPVEQQVTSAITVGEPVYGTYLSQRRDDLLRQFETRLWPRIRVLPFDRPAAEAYGQVRVGLERAGTPLPDPGLRIASIALSRELTVVTGNVRHFSRVAGLRVENWI